MNTATIYTAHNLSTSPSVSRTMDTAIAARSHRFRQGGCTNRLEFSLSALRALNISTTTSTVIAMVDGRRSANMAHE